MSGDVENQGGIFTQLHSAMEEERIKEDGNINESDHEVAGEHHETVSQQELQKINKEIQNVGYAGVLAKYQSKDNNNKNSFVCLLFFLHLLFFLIILIFKKIHNYNITKIIGNTSSKTGGRIISHRGTYNVLNSLLQCCDKKKDEYDNDILDMVC